MKTSAIVHRVADFLKNHPPFCYLETSAVETVAASGRVRFHERDEILFSEGDRRDDFLRVIQQGSVRLSRREGGEDQTLDMLGTGDLVGLGGMIEHGPYEQSATTLSETVLYALDWKVIAGACAASPKAARFLQTFALTGPKSMEFASVEGTPPPWSSRMVSTVTELARTSAGLSALISCRPETTVQAAAALMQSEGVNALLVTDKAGCPLGQVTTSGLLTRMTEATANSQAPVGEGMESVPALLSANASLSACWREMMRRNCGEVCLTTDGTAQAAAVAWITERDLLRRRSGNPAMIVRALNTGRNMEALVELRESIDAFLRSELRGVQDMAWPAEIATEANRALLRRLLELSEAATATRLGTAAPGEYCLALVGEAGRGEVLTSTPLESILIFDDGVAERRDWFAAMAEDLVQRMALCGFRAPVSDFSPANPNCRLSLQEWRERFSRWIASPIEYDINTHLPLLDFNPVRLDDPLATALRESLHETVARHPAFVRLLANDCFENLPPLTIFEGYAVDAEGVQKTEELELRAHATQPLADVARVFQLAAGEVAPSSTLERLARAERAHPEARRVFEQGAQAFRIALAYRAMVGLKMGTDGASIRPASLPRADQVLLKSSFRSIAALLEYAAHAHGFVR